MDKYKSVYILNLEAKDLWLAEHLKEPDPLGYNIHCRDGTTVNLRRFSGSVDESLDWIKMRRVYSRIYRKPIEFRTGGKLYSKSVINVNYNLSVKSYNKYFYSGTDTGKTKNTCVYVKAEYDKRNVELENGICIRDGVLVAVVCYLPLPPPTDDTLLGDAFVYEDGVYKEKNLPTLVTTQELRKWTYTQGFTCDGTKYVRYKRSNGSARIGKCLFIDEKLYTSMSKWQRCGIDPESYDNFDLAGFEAYIGLTLSSMIGTITIRPENILVIDDYEAPYHEEMYVTRDVDGWLETGREVFDGKNAIWDGQSLLDESMFPEEFKKYGMLLLRNRFFKSCCFNTNIRQWFADNGITEVSQLKGRTLAENISDIKLITTPNSIKYLKFGFLTSWLRRLDPVFGIVKHEKPTHYLGGRLVSTHYQLINTLEMSKDEVHKLLLPTLDFIELLDKDPAVLRHYIKFHNNGELSHNIKTKNDVIYELLKVTDRFAETKLYEDFKIDLMKSIKSDARKGRIRVHGNYSTLFGNPVEMLLAAIGKFDGTSQLGVGNICTKEFPPDTDILGSRSPHVCASNVYLARNVSNPEIDRYFNLTEQIVAVNSIGEPLLDRLSGSDFDSDTCMLTDNKILIEAARRNYHKFLVPTGQVQATKVKRQYNLEQLADLDIKTSVNKIGEIINLAQVLTTKYWDNRHRGQSHEENEELYRDIITLDILSNLEIDKAKREYAIDSKREIDKIRKKYHIKTEDGKIVMPKFLGYIAKTKGYYNSVHKSYKYHKSSMDYVEAELARVRFPRREVYTELAELIRTDVEYDSQDNRYTRQAILNKIDYTKTQLILLHDIQVLSAEEKKIAIAEIIKERDEYISKLNPNDSTIKMLIQTIENKQFAKYRHSLFNMLFNVNNTNFYNMIEASREPIAEIEQDDSGDIDIYGFKYKYKTNF